MLQRLDPIALCTGEPGLHSAYARAMYPAWFSDPELAQLLVPPRSESRTGAAVAATLRREDYDWSALVRAVQVEALVTHGEDDLLPSSVARELVALMPNARLALIPHAGHMPFWEAPETFFGLLETFLDQ